MQHKCSYCPWQRAHFFCSLSDQLIREFETLKITHAYSRGSTLFFEGQPSNGVYMLCFGRVKLTTYSKDGRVLIMRVAEPGELLGLSATVSNVNYEATAEVMEACQVNFVRKSDFVAFINDNTQPALNAIKQLSHAYHAAFSQVRSLGLSATVADKLAELLLDWCRQSGDSGSDLHLKMPYTQGEIAEMIGSTRETVSRILKYFRSRDLIRLHGSNLHIPSRKKLEDAIGVRVQM